MIAEETIKRGKKDQVLSRILQEKEKLLKDKENEVRSWTLLTLLLILGAVVFLLLVCMWSAGNIYEILQKYYYQIIIKIRKRLIHSNRL